mgnify:FL=1
MLSKILLTGSIFDTIGEVFLKLIYFIMLTIDSVVFWFVKLISQVFFLVVDTNMEGQAITTKINELMDRIYIILGVGMLFFVAYKIICLMTDPDKISNDGADSMQGIVKNVVLSVIMLSLIPTTFNYLMQFQSRVVSTNVIGSIILGTSNNSSDDNNIRKTGAKVALSIYSSFYYPVDENGKIYTYFDCGGRYPEAPNTPSGVPDICETYVKKYDDAMNSEGIKEFIVDEELNQALVDGEMEHIAIIPVLAGAYAVWLYLVFTLDIATRAIKLLFYRLIAPIPVMMRITKPVGGAFTRWINDVVKTYLSLFIRLIIINFSLFTINLIVSLDLSELFPSSTTATGLAVLLAKVAVLLGILQFAKDAPKMVEELFGVEHIDTSVAGMKNRLNENEYAKRAAVAGGALGLGGARAGWNAIQGRFNKKSDQYAERQKRKQERNAYNDRRRQYREGLSGAGRVADSVAHGVSAAFGAVGAAGRAAARTVGTAGRGLAAGNVDINEIGNAIAGQDAANKQRYAEQDQKRAQRRQRAVKNKLNTGSYFFPSVQGAVGNLIDSIPDVEVSGGNVVREGQQTKKDVGGWLTGMVNKALGTTSSAAASADKAVISAASESFSRITDLPSMKGKDTELNVEKDSRRNATISNAQEAKLAERTNYDAKVGELLASTAQQKSAAVSTMSSTYSQLVRDDATRATHEIDNNANLSVEQKTEAKQQIQTKMQSQLDALSTNDLQAVTQVIKDHQTAVVANITNDTSLSDAEKQRRIEVVTNASNTNIATITTQCEQLDQSVVTQKAALDAEYQGAIAKISASENAELTAIDADIKQKKMDAKVKALKNDAEVLKIAGNAETEKSFMDSINKMSRESQSAIYSPKMAETLGLAAADATPENIQREIRKTFSDLRAGNVNEQTVLTIEQLKKSLETAKRISDLAAVNSGKKENGGDKK